MLGFSDLVSYFFVVFLLTHLYIKYLKYHPRFRVFKGIFEEYYYCYACLGFWISVPLTFWIFINDITLQRHESYLLSFIVALSILFNLNTSKLFEKIRENGFYILKPNIFIPVISFTGFLLSLYFPVYTLPLAFSFVNVLLKLSFEKLGVFDEL